MLRICLGLVLKRYRLKLYTQKEFDLTMSEGLVSVYFAWLTSSDSGLGGWEFGI